MVNIFLNIAVVEFNTKLKNLRSSKTNANFDGQFKLCLKTKQNDACIKWSTDVINQS